MVTRRSAGTRSATSNGDDGAAAAKVKSSAETVKTEVKEEDNGCDDMDDDANLPAGASDEEFKPSIDAPIHTPSKRSGASNNGSTGSRKRSAATTPLPATTPRSTRSSARKRVKTEDATDRDGDGDGDVKLNGRASSKKTAKKELGTDEEVDEKKPKVAVTPSPSKSTLAKKLKQLEAYLQTPFPEWKYPTPEQCQATQDALVKVHGLPQRPTKLVDREGAAAGCGAVPDVLDALVRTILSQNTTSANSTRAKEAMDEKFGRANYLAVHHASHADLAETIKHGGLANNKSKSIKAVLASLVQKQLASGSINDEEELKEISLDYLHELDDLEAMKELVSFDGVGPKTASCVLLFCLGRNSFAVDTHVFRITKALGWTPAKANRETAFQHLDVRIPSENKYPLHSLFVRHGRSCRLCSANGNITEKEVDAEACPIKALLKEQRQRGSKDSSPSKSPSKRGAPTKREAKEEDADEAADGDEDLVMPGEIADKEEDEGKPDIGVGKEEVGPEVVWEGQIKP